MNLVARAFPFVTRDGRKGVVREARGGDARACLEIVAEAARERPRTLAVLEKELWKPRDWRKHRIPWGPHGVSLVAEVGGKVVGHLNAERGRRMVTRHSVAQVVAPEISAASSKEASIWRSAGVSRITMIGTVVSVRCTQMMPGIE